MQSMKPVESVVLLSPHHNPESQYYPHCPFITSKARPRKLILPMHFVSKGRPITLVQFSDF